jgi:hypothetical protein
LQCDNSKRLKDLAPTGVYVLPTQDSLWRMLPLYHIIPR